MKTTPLRRIVSLVLAGLLIASAGFGVSGNSGWCFASAKAEKKEKAEKQVERIAPAAIEDGLAVFFSPNGGCEQAVVDQINAAKKMLDVQAYSFTSKPIAEAILRARKRGVRIRIVLDASNQTDKYSAATFLFNEGLKPLIDGEHAIAHNKVMLIDGRMVITGSFNFTKSAEDRNAENLLIITGKPAIYRAYSLNFQEHMHHSQAYELPAEQPAHEEQRR